MGTAPSRASTWKSKRPRIGIAEDLLDGEKGKKRTGYRKEERT